MTQVVVRAEHLFKQYQFGQLGYGTLYRDIQSWWARRRGNEDPNARIVDPAERAGVIGASNEFDRFFALDDVSFEVRQGEALGIIGRNGAGKTTLLKVLSRITAPSNGVVRLKGRVASLLEVGTGFHPELTGRENVYLNGAILGMRRAEIRKRFDEVVAFAEIERFIDTPVKRYSSGMYVRLAFAVAAHLQSDILILDEVLAVGDAKFVQKCTEKMKSAQREGRTILFVSHGMSSVLDLCPRTLLLEGGKLIADGPSEDVVRQYRGQIASGVTAAREWPDDLTAPGFASTVRLLSVRLLDQAGRVRGGFGLNEPIDIEIRFRVLRRSWALSVHAYVDVLGGPRVLVSMDSMRFEDNSLPRAEGVYVERCRLPAHLLNEGNYSVEALICTNPTTTNYVTVPQAVIFSVDDDRSDTAARGSWDREWPASLIRPVLEWNIEHDVSG